MKISKTLIEKLIRLRDGEWLPASQLKGSWIDELLLEGVLTSKSHGARRTLHAPDGAALCRALTTIDGRLANLDLSLSLLKADVSSRADQASQTGNSKLIAVRSCPGFPVNSYQPISCWLNGEKFVVYPKEGSFLFITDWQQFKVPEDVVVVGIENMENFRMIRRQRALFEKSVGTEPLLFVSRYPQSSDLRQWLQMIPNRYVHFGDFDLAGIRIFLVEFNVYLQNRSAFLIPDDIELRLQNGSAERYQAQYQRFKGLHTSIPGLQRLIDTINTLHRCYDQEGYIE